jgi:hypothetical protein
MKVNLIKFHYVNSQPTIFFILSYVTIKNIPHILALNNYFGLSYQFYIHVVTSIAILCWNEEMFPCSLLSKKINFGSK